MYISKETLSETNRRLLRVAKSSRLEPLIGEWYFEEFPVRQLPKRLRPDALAVVRDGDRCSQLIQIRSGDRLKEKFRIWTCHFPPGVDNSGFIGWLATRIKRATGCGVFVVCGQNSSDGGIYDYWGCPSQGAGAVFRELRELVGMVNVVQSRRWRRPSF